MVKRIVTGALLLFVVASVGMLVFRGMSGGSEETGAAPAVAGVQNGDPLSRPDVSADVVYYFMTSQRCVSCEKIEAYSHEVLAANYGNEIDDSRMLWRVVNVEEPDNTHFIKDFELFTKSVVLVRYRDGKIADWRNLTRVWELVNDKTTFQEYVKRELDDFFTEG